MTVKPQDIKVALYGCVDCVLFKSRGNMLGLLYERQGIVGTPHTGQESMVSLAEGVPSCEGTKYAILQNTF